MTEESRPYWSLPAEEALRRLESGAAELSAAEALRRQGKSRRVSPGQGQGRRRADLAPGYFDSP